MWSDLLTKEQCIKDIPKLVLYTDDGPEKRRITHTWTHGGFSSLTKKPLCHALGCRSQEKQHENEKAADLIHVQFPFGARL